MIDPVIYPVLGPSVLSSAPLSAALPTAGSEVPALSEVQGNDLGGDVGKTSSVHLIQLLAGRHSATEGVNGSRDISVDGGSGPGKRSSLRLYSNPYRPWNIPDETEATIRRIFDDEAVPVKDRINAAAYEIAKARLSSIGKEDLSPNNYESLERYFLEDVGKIDVHDPNDDLVLTSLGRYITGDMIVSINPVCGNITASGLGSAVVKMHEFDHMSRLLDPAKKRPLDPTYHQPPSNEVTLMGAFIGIVNPFTPVTDVRRHIYLESHAYGAEWELLHRIPKKIRDQIMDEMIKNMAGFGLEPDIMRNGKISAARKEIRNKFPNPRSIGLAIALETYWTFKFVQLAEGDKRGVINLERLSHGDTYGRKIPGWFKIDRDRKEDIVLFVMTRSAYLAKMAGYAYFLPIFSIFF